MALNKSITALGINAAVLHDSPYNLLGRKIGIGQVEIGRPGVFGFDKVAAWQPPLKLQGFFHQNQRPIMDEDTDTHAMMVAMVMASQDKRLTGVAPEAKLYSAAVGADDINQGYECQTAQYVASQNGGDVRAINFSFGATFIDQGNPSGNILDGNSLLTQCIDWSSRTQDTLYVIAGNQGQGGIPIPTDNFNGITTAYTMENNGAFSKVDFANLSSTPDGVGRSVIKKEINAGDRRAVSLLAPGANINVYNLEGKKEQVSGTSFAAPHITGTVALIQEHGDRQWRSGRQDWSLDSRRHEVTKAVLLNSADKIQDQGDGLALGMARTIYSKHNETWLQRDAYRDPQISLDMEMGTGHLNALRAYEQLNSGQFAPGAPSPSQGWNYETIAQQSGFQDYPIKDQLKGQSYFSVTMAWDRLVELNDQNQNEQYDPGETFNNFGLNNLDIYVLPANSNDLKEQVCASTSKVDSVEHIFCKIPKDGAYKIRVVFQDQVNEATQSYGLAWWGVSKNS
jgi:hypothetical protein